MRNDTINTGWNDVGEDPVPVRSADTPIAKEQIQELRTSSGQQVVATVHQHAMNASAITGIAIVLIGTIFYFGVDSLLGSLTNSTGARVTITSDGHFSPPTVTLTPGSVLTIENQNAEPQVLKSIGQSELFPVQVLFESQSQDITIPSDADGLYLYVSETLPDTESLSITVTTSIESAAVSSLSSSQSSATISSSSTSTSGTAAFDEIPLPFFETTNSAVSSSTSSQAPVVTGQMSSSAGIAVVSMQGANETVSISVGGAFSSSAQSSAPKQAALETNPYTVAAQQNGTLNQENAARHAAAKLHSGAPLQQYARPRTNTSTGPELWLALLPASLLTLGAYRKICA